MYMQEESYPTAPDISITIPGIEKLLNSLKTNKAPGPDSIQPRILKELSSHIVPILTVIFNYSIETGDIPSEWRNANVAPIIRKTITASEAQPIDGYRHSSPTDTVRCTRRRAVRHSPCGIRRSPELGP